MNIDVSIQRIVHEIQYLHAARSEQTRGQLKLVVIHGYRQPGTNCLPGETIEQIYLIAEGRWIALCVSAVGSAIIDIFARKRNRALSAQQIQFLLSSDPFIRRLGANAMA